MPDLDDADYRRGVEPVREGPQMDPEEAALDAFAQILAKKRGGTWLPVKRDKLDVAAPRAGEIKRSLVSPANEDPVLNGEMTTPRGTA